MKEINLFSAVGSFAENKDIAKDIRLNQIIPLLEKKEEVVLNFEGIESATQSFIHALISDLFRKYEDDILDNLAFKNCNETTKKIIKIVVDYMQAAE